MRRSLALAGVAVLSLSCATARADDRPFLQRFAERTPYPHIPVEHSAQRAGYPLNVSRHAIPSVTRFDNGGYVGGASLRGNSLTARGPGSAVGPVCNGTYGTDFGGFRGHLGRVFLAPSYDPSRGSAIAGRYRAEGPRLTDIGTLRPFRKAVLEKREDAEERKHGGEGHGEAGHGAGAAAAHGAEGAMTEGGH